MDENVPRGRLSLRKERALPKYDPRLYCTWSTTMIECKKVNPREPIPSVLFGDRRIMIFVVAMFLALEGFDAPLKALLKILKIHGDELCVLRATSSRSCPRGNLSSELPCGCGSQALEFERERAAYIEAMKQLLEAPAGGSIASSEPRGQPEREGTSPEVLMASCRSATPYAADTTRFAVDGMSPPKVLVDLDGLPIT